MNDAADNLMTTNVVSTTNVVKLQSISADRNCQEVGNGPLPSICRIPYPGCSSAPPNMLCEDEVFQIDGDVGALIAEAGLEADEPFSMRRLFAALKLHPPEPAPMRVEGCLAWVRHRPRVYYRRGLSVGRARWRIGHELAHWWYEHRAGPMPPPERLELYCDAFGAILCAPRPLLARALRRWGDCPVELARRLKTTQSLVLLRLGEARGVPVAVVRRAGAIVRGAPFAWPSQLELRAARAVRHPAVRRVAIDDEPGRVGLLAA